MVVSTAQQHRSTYLLWERFSMPTESGAKDAITVPDYVANQLISAYTLMVTMTMMNFWIIISAIVVYFLLKRDKVHPLTASLWNNRASLCDQFLTVFFHAWTNYGSLWIYPLILLILIAWIAQLALSIIIAPYIFLGNAAPVNPDAIFVLPIANRTQALTAKIFALEAPSALRAAGSAQVADDNLRKKVRISDPVIEQDLGDGEAILRIDYGYNITGADFGLQHFPDLALYVQGSCRTEYDWLDASELQEEPPVTLDTYREFNKSDIDSDFITVSLYDGVSPSGNFEVGDLAAEPGNITWAAFISSVDRSSFTAGTDPWYLTTQADSGADSNDTSLSVAYIVKPKRPALSCWQQDIWSFHGANSTITDLDKLPGLNLPAAMQEVLVRFLGVPKIVPMATRLGGSALASSETSLGEVFDAGASSIYADMKRLVLAAYVATSNVLIDSTLLPIRTSNSQGLLNQAVDETGQVRKGVADFVVWSSDVATLSVAAIIAIPTVALALWIVVLILLYKTQLKRIMEVYDPDVVFEKLKAEAGEWWKKGEETPKPEQPDAIEEKKVVSSSTAEVPSSPVDGLPLPVTAKE